MNTEFGNELAGRMREKFDKEGGRCVVCNREAHSIGVWVMNEKASSEFGLGYVAYFACKKHYKDYKSCEASLSYDLKRGREDGIIKVKKE